MSHQDQVEFTLWLRENQSAFLKAAKVICFDTQNAEDVLQEALADVYKRWSKIRDHENPEGYLMRVMVSKHADMRRKWLRKQEERETSWDLAENIRDIADQTDDVTQRLLVQAALKSLSAIQRAVLVLIYEHGMVLREVAEVLQIPMGTAASHLARGKAAVAAYVELVPELEKSSTKELSAPTDNVREILIAEVVDSNE
ncbi:MAG: sigma-70 family RNA polymerase sigma factor [Candidatus Planktophila sp.]|jgi:RNA polymerase sigma factor (sigma-70 family)|nr:sigma-70 family RNA polymerase sigma factor [Candidatus Planktophila sp.]